MPVIELEAFEDRVAGFLLDDEPLRPKASPCPTIATVDDENSHDWPIEDSARTQASSQYAPSVTFRSTPTDKSPTRLENRNTPSSGRQSPISGEPPLNAESIISRATSRRLTNPLAMEQLPNVPFMNHEAAGVQKSFDDDSILEPYPYERVRTSLSELITASPSQREDSVDLTRFGGHRDTFAILGLRHLQHRNIDLPLAFFQRLLHFIDFPMYLLIRLSCRSWSNTISQIRPISLPAVCQLPTEILEKILYHLSPLDFNSTRHTCRAWMISSLESPLLKHMLKCGGWMGAATSDLTMIERSPRMSIINEWPLSKRLATECQLLPGWSGNGLARGCIAGSGAPFDSQYQISPSGSHTLTAVLEIDFRNLGSDTRPAAEQQYNDHFTPSACGKYLLYLSDRTIYVFSITRRTQPFTQDDRGDLEAITRFICPAKILAASLDTSYGRFSLAALLEGRVGIVCDLQDVRTHQRKNSLSQIPMASWKGVSRSSLEGSSDDSDVDVKEPRPVSSLAFYNRSGQMTPFAKGERPLTETPECYDTSPGTSQFPIEQGTRSIYRNLCSFEDPPTSVAVCPQRRCVAFGCSAGIELHWSDILTGQNKNRWIPLANASDHLYFLPPRASIDTFKHLRVLSSAVHPSKQTDVLAKFAPQVLEQREEEMIWESTNNTAFGPSKEGKTSDEPDHYHAIPLSDGYHVLYTDPVTGEVCLGLERPHAVASSSRFTKRVIFSTPHTAEYDRTGVPECYAAAVELSWGIRVAVGYTDGGLWLFSVPRDMFLASHNEKDCQLDWLGHYDTYESATDNSENNGHSPALIAWPMQIPGVKIANIDGLEDLCVDASNGSVAVWTFSIKGLMRRYEMSNGLAYPIKRSIVLVDGTIVDAEDDDGDYNMRDAPWVPSYTSTPNGYDGTSSLLRFHTAPNSVQRGSTESTYTYASGESSHQNVDCQNSDSDSTYTYESEEESIMDSDVEMTDAYEASLSDPLALTEIDPSPPPPQLRTALPTDGALSSHHDNPIVFLPHSNSVSIEDFEDEGYESAEPGEWAASPFAIRIPGLDERWSAESMKEHDWTPDYLRARQEGSGAISVDGSLDLLDLADVEVEVL